MSYFFIGRPALRGPAFTYAAISASVIIQTWPNFRPSLPVRHSLRTRDWSIDKRRATSVVVSVSTIGTPNKRKGNQFAGDRLSGFTAHHAESKSMWINRPYDGLRANPITRYGPKVNP
jgi:hypothetical protein